MYGLEGTDMEPSQEEIERVASLANAHAFIEVCSPSLVICLEIIAKHRLTLA